MKGVLKKVLGVLDGGRDLVFPPSCVRCEGMVESGGEFEFVCGRCAEFLTRVEAPFCGVCGHPFYGMVADEEQVCPHCLELRAVYGEGRTLVLFKGAARDLVHELKYHQGLHVLRDMERLARGNGEAMEWLRGAVLVPVPLHERKRRERGFNQAVLWAETLARAAGGGTRVEKGLLRRVKDNVSQTFLDREERRKNLMEVFAVAKGARVGKGERYVLVDDVFTTGATLNECARVLLKAGAKRVDVVTFGHG